MECSIEDDLPAVKPAEWYIVTANKSLLVQGRELDSLQGTNWIGKVTFRPAMSFHVILPNILYILAVKASRTSLTNRASHKYNSSYTFSIRYSCRRIFFFTLHTQKTINNIFLDSYFIDRKSTLLIEDT
ncbi:hypothetical protein, partial [Yersinia aleksiciae]|uniref:hypothetical protein n=1 Tax=Yersinia aleksiciae TaxID=263819 RepID=UPI001C95393D